VIARRFDVGLSRLVAGGSDRKDFLERMSTNEVASLRPGEGCVTLLLERTGRLVDRLHMLERGEDCLLLGNAARAAAVVEWIRRYVIADDVTIEDVSAATHAVTVAGPDAAEVLLERGLPGDLPRWTHAQAGAGGSAVTVTRAEDVGGRCYHVLRPADAEDPLADVPEGTADEYDRWRVAAGLPAFGAEWDENTIPLEAGMTSAISFTKGCYLGQEVISRVTKHDRVKRSLVRLQVEGRDAPPPGTELTAEGAVVGRITSSTVLDERVLALGQIERGHERPGSTFGMSDDPTGRRAVVAPTPEQEP
jgi:folate-binding protein YgfZ